MRSGDRTAAGQRQGPTAMQIRAFDPHVCVQVGPFIISISMFEIAVGFDDGGGVGLALSNAASGAAGGVVEIGRGESGVEGRRRRNRAGTRERVEIEHVAGRMHGGGGNDRSDAEVTALIRKVVHRGESAVAADVEIQQRRRVDQNGRRKPAAVAARRLHRATLARTVKSSGIRSSANGKFVFALAPRNSRAALS
nr:hypothetical protein Iba_chr14eCG3970 [Ipomoea batatas]